MLYFNLLERSLSDRMVVLAINALYVTVPFSFIAMALLIRSTFTFSIAKKQDEIEEGSSLDAVTLYIFGASPNRGSGSPFAYKSVVYARFAGIPHICKDVFAANAMGKNKKGKVPFIEHDGKVITDSQLLIRYLDNTFDVAKMSEAVKSTFPGALKYVPFNALSSQQQAISTLVRVTLENDIFWAIMGIMWMGEVGISENEGIYATFIKNTFGKVPAPIRALLIPFLRANTARDCWAQGLIRHSPKDQLYLAKRSLEAVSTTLGNKMYFLGDDFLSEVDVVAYAFVSVLVLERLEYPNPLSDFVFSSLPNLVRYTERLDKIYFSDFKKGDKLAKSHPEFKPILRKSI